MISFELKKSDLKNDPSEVAIFLDGEGLESLIAQLRLLQAGKTDHVHLMSEAWGGSHLEGSARTSGNTPIHHVKIQMTAAHPGHLNPEGGGGPEIG